MSNLVFPAPSPSQFAFGWPVRRTPSYHTLVQKPASRRGELRIPTQTYPIWQFDLDVNYLTGDASQPDSYFSTLLGFYMAAQGAAADWLYSDPYDNSVTAMRFGTGDGATTAFQLTRMIGTGVGAGVDIVQNLNGTPAIYVNGVLQTSGVSVSATGVVTFTTAPASGAAVTWSGGFYFRCRFGADNLDSMQEDLYQVWSIKGLKFQSVIL